MCAHRRSQAVNHQVDLAEVGFDERDGFVFHFRGKSVSIDAFSVQSGFFGFPLKCGAVVPAWRCRFAFLPGFSKKTPMVPAFEPNALVIRDDRPKPVDAPITSTFLGPSTGPLDRTYAI